jgi:hypothetical protein
MHEIIIQSLLENDDFDVKSFIERNFRPIDKSHLFVSSTDGGLYDTRKPDWHKGPPLRQNFQRFHTRIYNVKDFKATWRARPYANYPLAFLTDDGAALCENCTQKNLARIISSIRGRAGDGWQVVGVAQCHGDGDDPEMAENNTQCANCNKNLGELA